MARKYDRSALVPEICGRLAQGTPLAVICRDIGISRCTVNLWRAEDEEIAAQFDLARDEGFDVLAAECLQIADTPQEGVEIVERGGKKETHHGDMLGHRKLRIETRLKLLAKWDPRRYGEKQSIDLRSSDGSMSPRGLSDFYAEHGAKSRSPGDT